MTEPKFLFMPPPPPEEPKKREPPKPPSGGDRSPIFALAASPAPQGRLLAVGQKSGLLSLWLPAVGLRILEARDHQRAIRALAFSPRDGVGDDGAYHILASGDEGGVLRTWHLGAPARGVARHLHDGGLLALAWTPDGASIVTASEDHSIAILDAGPSIVHRFSEAHDASILAVACSDDGRIASGGFDSRIRTWDVHGRRRLTSVDVDEPVWSIAWLPDGRIAYAAGSYVGLLDGTRVTRFTAPFGLDGRCYALAARADGTRVATAFGPMIATADPTSPGGVATAGALHGAQVHAATYLPDGRLASGGDGGLVHLGDGPGAGTWLGQG